MKYNIDMVIKNHVNQEYLFFWKHNLSGVIDKSCLSQWQKSRFIVDKINYTHAEQYMMAEKARLFGDKEKEKEIMLATHPHDMKAFGQQVKNFNAQIWDNAKYAIVLNGCYHKFTQNPKMREFLLATGSKILVEASPFDDIWGIKLKESDSRAHNPRTWKGENLLGFALMEVRDKLK